MRLRTASPADAARIAEIYAHYVETSVATFDEVAPAPEAMAEKIDATLGAGLPFLVAGPDGGRVDGYAHLSPFHTRPAYRRTAEVSVYVADGARGGGLGRALLEGLVAGARQRTELRELIARIADTGEPASLALHRACGFRDAGLLESVGFKHGRWVDVRLLQRSLRD